MTHTFKPGDVAMVECSDGQWRRAVLGENLHGLIWKFPDGTYRLVDESHARPLVVIDPEDREQVERLCTHMMANGWTGIDEEAPSDMQVVLRSLIESPKPEEPLGLGAVVETANGDLYVRSKNITTVAHWKPAHGGTRRKYEHLNVVRVLSKGVEPC